MVSISITFLYKATSVPMPSGEWFTATHARHPNGVYDGATTGVAAVPEGDG